MKILRGSGYVASPMPSGSGVIVSRLSSPYFSIPFCNAFVNMSFAYSEDCLRRCFICFFVKSPSNPYADGSMAMSMSSENLSIRLPSFDKDVPPLKMIFAFKSMSNNICSRQVTHKSFSIAFDGKPSLFCTCSIIVRCCGCDNVKKSVIQVGD